MKLKGPPRTYLEGSQIGDAAFIFLSRRLGETINLNHLAVVHVHALMHAQVRFGIDAPKNIVVDRKEVADRKKETIDAEHSQPE